MLTDARPASGESSTGGLFHRILVAIDDTEPARWALTAAARLASEHGSVVALIHVVPLDIAMTPEFTMLRTDIEAQRRKLGQELLDRAQQDLGSNTPCETLLREGDVTRQIVAGGRDWDADIIILGTHGRGSLAHFLLGSTAEAVVRSAHCPVLTVGQKPRCASHPSTSTGPAREPACC